MCWHVLCGDGMLFASCRQFELAEQGKILLQLTSAVSA